METLKIIVKYAQTGIKVLSWLVDSLGSFPLLQDSETQDDESNI